MRTVTDFVVLPKLNDKETICRMFVYSNPAMQLQRVFKFRTQPIFDLYDFSVRDELKHKTKEEVVEFGI